MKVISIVPRGYCKGVINAINIAKETRQNHPHQNIYILGMLVHNKYVIEALEKLNIKTLDDTYKSRLELLDEIDNGLVIFSAHGVSDQVYQKALDKGLTIVDATCGDVKKIHDIIKEYISDDYTIIYIGINKHPEAEGVLGISENIHLVTSSLDLAQLKINHPKILITNQTTMSINDIEDILTKLRQQYPQAIIMEEICQATRIRQEAILKLEYVDLIYIVGDPKSNNTRNLAKLAYQHADKVCLIENVTQINPNDLFVDATIAVTSGASTPTKLTNQVIDYLENFDGDKPFPSISMDIL